MDDKIDEEFKNIIKQMKDKDFIKSILEVHQTNMGGIAFSGKQPTKEELEAIIVKSEKLFENFILPNIHIIKHICNENAIAKGPPTSGQDFVLKQMEAAIAILINFYLSDQIQIKEKENEEGGAMEAT